MGRTGPGPLAGPRAAKKQIPHEKDRSRGRGDPACGLLPENDSHFAGRTHRRPVQPGPRRHSHLLCGGGRAAAAGIPAGGLHGAGLVRPAERSFSKVAES